MNIENKNTKEKENSNNYYKQLFEESPISITLLDLEGRIVEVNSATIELSGIKREDLIGENFSTLFFIPQDNMEEMKKIFKTILKGDIYGPKDIQIYNRNKQLTWINVVGSLVKVDKELLIQVLTQDITSRKKLEEKLEKSEEKYRLFTENANDLITVVDSKLNVEYINQEVHKKIMGYEDSDVLGTKAIDLIHPEDRENVLRAFKESLEKGEGFVDARVKHKDGYYVWTETSGKMFIDIDNKPKFLLLSRNITERVKAAQKLKETKDKYRNLADSLPEVIFEVDLDYNLTYTNSIATKIFGYTHEDFKKGLKVYDFLALEDKEFVLEKLNLLFKGKYVEPLIVQLKRKDGTFFYSSIYATRIFKEGKIVGVRSIIHDISEMKIAQEKIKESEQKFRTIAEQSLMGICIIQDEVIKYINHTLAKLLGYDEEEMLKWKPGEFFKTIHPEDKRKIIELATKKEEEFENGIRYYEARGLSKKGELIWFEVYYKSIIFQNKPAFLISFIDISQRKNTEEKLIESEKKYRFLFEKSPSPILLIDYSGRIVDCNPSIEQLLGYSKIDLIGKKYSKLPIVPKPYLPILLERLGKIAQGEIIPSIDIELHKKDGSLIWVNIESSLVKLGDKPFIIVMGHDISQKKEIETKLKELDIMRKDFIDKASHELKTPITTIYGAYQLLDNNYKDKFDSDEREIFEMAFNGTRRLKKLVDDLLDVSRLESDMFKLEKERVDLSNLIKNCVNEMKYLMKVRDQTYSLILPNSFYMNIDSSRIELVIINLISNAIKYTPSKGSITLKLEKKNNFALISISDTGIGLTPKDFNNLFKKFSKISKPIHTELETDLESTGLGLHIAKAIVDLHGGEIWAESEGKNEGSTFFIKLPIV